MGNPGHASGCGEEYESRPKAGRGVNNGRRHNVHRTSGGEHARDRSTKTMHTRKNKEERRVLLQLMRVFPWSEPNQGAPRKPQTLNPGHPVGL